MPEGLFAIRMQHKLVGLGCFSSPPPPPAPTSFTCSGPLHFSFWFTVGAPRRVKAGRVSVRGLEDGDKGGWGKPAHFVPVLWINRQLPSVLQLKYSLKEKKKKKVATGNRHDSGKNR